MTSLPCRTEAKNLVVQKTPVFFRSDSSRPLSEWQRSRGCQNRLAEPKWSIWSCRQHLWFPIRFFETPLRMAGRGTSTSPYWADAKYLVVRTRLSFFD